MEMPDRISARPDLAVVVVLAVLVAAYLIRLNQLLLHTPDEIKKMASTTWTKELLRDTYRRLERHPVEARHYANRIPPKLERRYIVTGGSGESALSAIEHGFGVGSVKPIIF